jgi:hypothetical protein
MKRVFTIVLAALLVAPSAFAQEVPSDSRSESTPPLVPESAPSPDPPLTPSGRLAACIAAEEYDRRVAVATSPARAELEKIAAHKRRDCASTPTAEDLPELARPTPVPPPRRRARLYGALEGGYAAQSVFGVSMSGGDITGRLGADLGSWDVGAQLELVPAKTEGGLNVFAGTVGPVAQAHIGRFRIGGGFRLGGFNVERATTNDTLFTLTVGMYGRVSFDVFRFDDEGRSALFLVGKGSLDSVNGSLLCVTVGVGVRF